MMLLMLMIILSIKTTDDTNGVSGYYCNFDPVSSICSEVDFSITVTLKQVVAFKRNITFVQHL
jgi:hypothetical protein